MLPMYRQQLPGHHPAQAQAQAQAQAPAVTPEQALAVTLLIFVLWVLWGGLD